MKKIIDDTLAQFKIIKRNDDSIITFSDTASEALKSSVMEAHGERMPEDWIFEKYEAIISALTQYQIDNVEDLEDKRAEIVDGLVDVYTSGLTAWLASHVQNVYFIDESIEEYGNTSTSGTQILQMAQYKAIDNIYSEVVNYLTAQIIN